MTILLTGLPCSGKTTIAVALSCLLRSSSRPAQVLDGDVIRHKLWKELGFSKSDREENLHRLAYLARLLSQNGVISIIAAVSPYSGSRAFVRNFCDPFIEVYVNAPLSLCETRDVKGMYEAAHKEIRHGKHPGFTGVDDPYEPPANPEVECRTDQETVAESVAKIVAKLKKQGALDGL
jgi:adenylylsulfate kinase